MPSNTVGWMSTPSVAVVVICLVQSTAPVCASSATSACQRSTPVARSSAATRPELSCRYTVSPTTIGTVLRVPETGTFHATCNCATFVARIGESVVARELS